MQTKHKPRGENHFPVPDKTFGQVKVNFPPDLNTVNQDGKRFYVIESAESPTGVREYFPSITTLLSQIPKPQLEQWKKRVGEKAAESIKNKAANRGTGLHKTVERYVLNEEMYARDASAGQLFLFQAIKKHLNRLDNIVGLEVPLYAASLKLAGRCDCIADFDGVPSIIDFKTSRTPKKKEWIDNYFVQAAFYSIAFEEMTGYRVKQLVVIIANEDGSSDVFIERRDQWAKILWGYIKQYRNTLVFDPTLDVVTQ